MLPIQTVSASVDPYVLKTEGIVTSSKLKTFMKCPFSYELIYKKKQPLERKVKTYFKMGTAIDDLFSYGEKKFLEKYMILEPGKNSLSLDDLESAKMDLEKLENELSERKERLDLKLKENKALEKEGKKPKATTAVQKSFDSWTQKVSEAVLKVEYIDSIVKFIQLTAVEGDMIAKLQREAERQELFDLNGEWAAQVEFEANFKGKLKLGGKPDRVRLGEGGMIRDTKLLEDIDKAEFKIQDNRYIQQLAFYQLLIELNTGQTLPCVLDIFDKKEVPRYRPMIIPQELLDEERNHIQAALEFMVACEENEHFPTHSELGTRDSGCCAYEFCPGGLKKNAETYS
jgi:hypothetical protein